MKKGTTKGKRIFSGRLHPIFSPTYYLCPYLFLVPLLLDSLTFYFTVLMLFDTCHSLLLPSFSQWFFTVAFVFHFPSSTCPCFEKLFHCTHFTTTAFLLKWNHKPPLSNTTIFFSVSSTEDSNLLELYRGEEEGKWFGLHSLKHRKVNTLLRYLQ